jgi:hypothetical protein
MQITPKDLAEALTVLYLRLNGFFTTGLIVHSPTKGRNRAEVDCLAVRHAFHDQAERGVETDPFLNAKTDRAELILCEVKTSPDALSFNEPLREDIAAVDAVLRWSGLVAPEAVDGVATELAALLQDDVDTDRARAGVERDAVRIRALLSCPGCSSASVQDRWCLTGEALLLYANRCLNPHLQPPSCSRRYSYELWGGYLAPLVLYFKKLRTQAVPTFKDLKANVWDTA